MRKEEERMANQKDKFGGKIHQQNRIYSRKEQLLMKNKEIGMQCKRQKQMNSEYAKYNIKVELEKNSQRSKMIKFGEELGIRRNIARKEYLHQTYQSDYLNRIREEKLLIESKEKEIASMEKKENNLIEKLQNTQSVQKDAFLELESALKYKLQYPNTIPE